MIDKPELERTLATAKVQKQAVKENASMYETKCRKCGKLKDNPLFTPSELKGSKWCRECVKTQRPTKAERTGRAIPWSNRQMYEWTFGSRDPDKEKNGK